MANRKYIKIGVAGPVGAGKTALIEVLSRKMMDDYYVCVITNDVYTNEDEKFLQKNSKLPKDRIAGVEMAAKHPDMEILFVESGGDNLSATFSPELADLTIFVIDVSAGEKIPRKGGPGITRSDLLMINKFDLAPLVGADLAVMESDAKRMRQGRPFVFTNLKTEEGVDAVIGWIKKYALLEDIEEPAIIR